MTDDLKEFLKENKKLLETNNLTGLYKIANYGLLTHNQVGELTQFLYDIKEDPLLYLEEIPPYYLYNNKTLKSINIPNNIIKIKSNAFIYSNLENINISSNVEEIEPEAFKNCPKLTKMVFPKDSKLKKISIAELPSNLKSLNLPAKAKFTIPHEIDFKLYLKDIKYPVTYRGRFYKDGRELWKLYFYKLLKRKYKQKKLKLTW